MHRPGLITCSFSLGLFGNFHGTSSKLMSLLKRLQSLDCLDLFLVFFLNFQYISFGLVTDNRFIFKIIHKNVLNRNELERVIYSE